MVSFKNVIGLVRVVEWHQELERDSPCIMNELGGKGPAFSPPGLVFVSVWAWPRQSRDSLSGHVGTTKYPPWGPVQTTRPSSRNLLE